LNFFSFKNDFYENTEKIGLILFGLTVVVTHNIPVADNVPVAEALEALGNIGEYVQASALCPSSASGTEVPKHLRVRSAVI
jgi:hypothetical protein